MPRKKIVDFEEEQEELEWDKKKIIITLVIIVILIAGGIFAKNYFLGDQTSQTMFSRQSVKGISTQAANEPLLPSQDDIKQQLTVLEAKASQLSVQDIASSSPQVQQLIHQVQALKDAPTNEIKGVCQQICGSVLK